MRDDQDHPNEWFEREIWINRRAVEVAIQEHRARKAQHDQDFQRFMAKVTNG